MKNRVERINPRCDQCGGDSSPQHSTLRSKLERRAAAADASVLVAADSGQQDSGTSSRIVPWHMQISNDDTKLYVSNRMSNSITIANLETNMVIANIEDETGTINMLHGCALSNNNDYLVVTSPMGGSAYVYDTSNNSLLHSIELSDGSDQNPMPTGVAIEQ